MEYYFPDHPRDTGRLPEIPAGAYVAQDWRAAFKKALFRVSGVIVDGPAVLYVIDVDPKSVASQHGVAIKDIVAQGRNVAHVFDGEAEVLRWGVLKKAALVQKVIEIDTNAWVLAAMNAKLGGGRNLALAAILDDLTATEPVVESDLDGICQIRPAKAPEESLTWKARQHAAEYRLRFGKEPPP